LNISSILFGHHITAAALPGPAVRQKKPITCSSGVAALSTAHIAPDHHNPADKIGAGHQAGMQKWPERDQLISSGERGHMKIF